MMRRWDDWKGRALDDAAEAARLAREVERKINRLVRSDSRPSVQLSTMRVDAAAMWADAAMHLLWALLAAILALAPSTAAAQPDHVLLARTCVSEAGWTSPDDCAAIHAVLLGIVERDGVTYRRAWALASPRLARCAVSRRWLCELREGHRMPRGLAHYAERWAAVLDLARALVAGEREPVCSPRSWGSRADVRSRSALGRATWVPVDCGETRNVFGAWRRGG